MTRVVTDPVDQVLPPLVGRALTDDERPLIEGASAMVRRFVGWHIAPVVEDTFTVPVPPGPIGPVPLPTQCLRAVLDVRVSGRPITGWTHTGGTLYVPGTVTDHTTLDVDVRHGYTLGEIADVAAVVEQVAAIAASSPTGVQREQVGAVAITYAATTPGVGGGLALLDRDKAILNSYWLGSAP